MKISRFAILAAALAAVALAPVARAADLPVYSKAPAYLSYPTGSGWFWGVSGSGLGGTTSSTGNITSGNLIGAKVGLDVGYTGLIGSGFYFVEQNFNAQAIQGPGNGLAVSATFGMEQRYAIGAPQKVVSEFVNIIPGLSSIAMPSLPLLGGVSVGPANWYVFAATYEDDVSASLGTATGKSWLFAGGAGIGAIYRASNGWAIDTSIEWKHNTQGMLIGPAPIAASVTPFADTYLATVRVKF